MNKAVVLKFLNLHHNAKFQAEHFANSTGHPFPSDTRSWSQILISLVTGIRGVERKKGSDFEDGSDVKAANAWDAIDNPRFNGVIKAGTKSKTSGKVESLNSIPYLFFVLWDHNPENERERCRIWVVRPRSDRAFRKMCRDWYELRNKKKRGSNFQLHPPIGENTNLFTNKCGNLLYPLLFCAELQRKGYQLTYYKPRILRTGKCKQIPD